MRSQVPAGKRRNTEVQKPDNTGEKIGGATPGEASAGHSALSSVS